MKQLNCYKKLLTNYPGAINLGVFMDDNTNIACSQSSELSVDSSMIGSLESSFQSTRTLSINDKEDNNDGKNLEQINFQSPKEKTRFEEINKEEEFFCGFQQPFIGFVGLGKGKGNAIYINQSKLKRAKKFMSLDQSPYFKSSPQLNFQVKNCTQNQSKVDCQQVKTNQQISQTKSYDNNNEGKFEQFDFSCGFKSLGSGTTVKISEQATNKVKLLFKQFDISQKKPTKQKLSKIHQTRQSQKFTNFTKTQKIKPNPPKQKVNNKKSISLSGCKIIQNMPSKMIGKYQRIKLSQMKDVSWEEIRNFGQFWEKYFYEDVEHSVGVCQTKWCYFCQKYPSQSVLVTKQFIKDQVLKLLSLQQSTKQRIPKLLDLIIFKLARYQYHDPAIQNRTPTPNNILIDLYKKCIAYQKQKTSQLQQSISSLITSRGKNLGKQIILLVTNITHSSEIDNYFIELSDGWTSIYAVISPTNQLYRFVYVRIFCGCKIQIVNWSIHPVCNIIECHPNANVASSGAICIEINYNNSMPAPYWGKLGWPKQPFYRQIDKCKQTGGSIPLVQGIILRMFTIKNQKNLTTNYIEILLSQNKCILMKVALAEQISLVQLFRLYNCYHFLRVKKISNILLQFSGNSKFYDIDDKHRIQKIKQIFIDRLINLNFNQDHIDEELKSCNKKIYVDVITKNPMFELRGKNFSVDEKIQGVVLLQQYTINFVRGGDGYVLSKGDRGSYLRRIPKIYDSIQYIVL